jgi:hypothetical protein
LELFSFSTIRTGLDRLSKHNEIGSKDDHEEDGSTAEEPKKRDICSTQQLFIDLEALFIMERTLLDESKYPNTFSSIRRITLTEAPSPVC